jgi:hypothetical protein
MHISERLSSYDSGQKFPVFDDCPKPEGCWKEKYQEQQKKYNRHLILGAGSLITTVAIVSTFLF